MSITDELREWARGFENVWFKPASKEIVVTTGTSMPVDHINMCLFIEGMLDRVDAEHDELLKNAYEDIASDEFLEGHGWVKLPVDADGAPIRVGDVVTMQLLFGGESKPLVVDRMELSHGRDGDLWCIALDTDKECWNQPNRMRHYTPPTVEDVLREFASDIADVLGGDDFRLEDNDELFAEYAAKLRLAGEGE